MAAKIFCVLAVSAILLGCGTDKAIVMEAKVDGSLRQRIAELQDSDNLMVLDILGKCIGSIDGVMRQDLLDAGAEVLSMTGDEFTARAKPSAIPDIAALDFVTQLQLARPVRPSIQ